LDLTSTMTDKKLIDDCFYVVKARFLWHSYDREDNGLVSALNEKTCIRMTRFYLKGKQDGWDEKTSRVVNDGVVGGKL
jgi:hypothetical protein